tara:strand:- start:367 stop:1218 length:852 start_codon:yes stop_codon:yes gene_type:complete
MTSNNFLDLSYITQNDSINLINTINECINITIDIFNYIILDKPDYFSNTDKHIIKIYTKSYTQSSSSLILGEAQINPNNSLGGTIWLNNDIFLHNYTCKLNDTEYPIYVTILIHEILHILGLVNTRNNINHYINDANSEPQFVYTGPYGVLGYKNVIENPQQINKTSFNIDNINDIIYLPLENNYIDGIYLYHIDEGLNDGENENNGIRIINGIEYPSITNEIITGYLNNENYITPITIGLLKDLADLINYLLENSYIIDDKSLINETSKKIILFFKYKQITE